MKTILITGSTDGIGKQTALELAEMGHELILHGRSESRGLDTIQAIETKTGNNKLHYINADLTSFSEVSKLADFIKTNFKKLDVLINNAAVFQNDKVIVDNGFERTFMINHLAPFALTLQLINQLEVAEEGRVVNVSSMAQSGTIDFDNLNGDKYFDGYHAYALSKLENVLFTYKLSRVLKHSSVMVNALHPGVIATKLLDAGWGSGGAPINKGAKTSVFVSVSASISGKSGLYFVDCKERRSSAISYDRKIQDRLWEHSLAYSCLKNPFNN